MKILPLNSQTDIPIVGFGTWKLTGDECYKSVEEALKVGYRHIDTADRYGNHTVIAQVIKDSKIPRKELFITTKVWHSDLHKQKVIDSAKRFLEELGTDYIDLLLIHWPNKDIPISETLQGFQTLKDQGLIKSIGVSNFTIHHLEDALQTGIEITNNQVEYHPSLNQRPLKDFCDKNNIIITAYSPMAQGYEIEIPQIKKLAQEYKKSPAQIILKWLINQNIIVIPKSTNPQRVKENIELFDWELSPEDIKTLDNLNEDYRSANPPFSEFDY